MNSIEYTEILVDESQIRLDVYLSKKLSTQLSRNFIQTLIKEKKILIFNHNIQIPENKIKPSFKLQAGMKIFIPQHLESFKNQYNITPIPLDIKILYEDEYLAIIHKPPGISVHPGPKERDTITLLHGIFYHWKELQDHNINLQNNYINFRPGLVHRLDKATEGLLIVAKNISTQWKLSKLFLTREIKKTYIAWVLGLPPQDQGIIDLPLKRHPKERTKMIVDPMGRRAITEYKIINSITSNHNRRYTKVHINLITGRTHQIRAHFHYLKCPVVGDDLYYHVDEKIKKYGLLLLAKELQFLHPETQKLIHVEIEEPKRFLEFEKKCKYY